MLLPGEFNHLQVCEDKNCDYCKKLKEKLYGFRGQQGGLNDV